MKSPTTVKRTSDRELVITRTINGPVHLVFEAWSKAELFRQWWVPKSAGLTLLSCDMDVRVGGKYRLVFRHGDASMAFFGTYLEVTPGARLSWTNEEGGGEPSITTVTFEEKEGKTLVVLHERHPSKEALDGAIGSSDGMGETFDQLDELLAGSAAKTANPTGN